MKEHEIFLTDICVAVSSKALARDDIIMYYIFFNIPIFLTHLFLIALGLCLRRTRFAFDKDLACEYIGDRKKAARAVRMKRRGSNEEGGSHVTVGEH